MAEGQGNSPQQGAFKLDIESQGGPAVPKKQDGGDRSPVQKQVKPQNTAMQAELKPAQTLLAPDEIDVPPRAFDALSQQESHRRTFEHFITVDRKKTEDEAVRVRMRARRGNNIDQRERMTHEKLLTMLGDVQEINANSYDFPMMRNKLTAADYAFEDRADFPVYNSALTGHGVFRYAKRTSLDTSIVISDNAFNGVHPNFERHDLSKRSEDLRAVNSLLYGKDFGKYLHGGVFERCVVGGDGALTNAENLYFKETYIVTPHGTYFLPDVKMEGRFKLDEKYRVK